MYRTTRKERKKTFKVNDLKNDIEKIICVYICVHIFHTLYVTEDKGMDEAMHIYTHNISCPPERMPFSYMKIKEKPKREREKLKK